MATIPSVCLCFDFKVDESDGTGQNGEEHQGGYSTHIRAQEKFVFHIPESLKSEDAASMYVELLFDVPQEDADNQALWWFDCLRSYDPKWCWTRQKDRCCRSRWSVSCFTFIN